MHLANAYFICLFFRNVRSYPLIFRKWDCSSLNITTLCVRHVTQGDYRGLANSSLTMGSSGRFTPSSCSAESSWPGALPHLASPHVSIPASRHWSGITRPCEPLPGPQRMWSGKWLHVECVCFDLSRLCSLQRIGFWYCLCLPLGNRSTIFLLFLILQRDVKKNQKKKKPILPIFHQSWTVYIMTCYDVFLRQNCLEMYKDIIGSSADERHTARCTEIRYDVVYGRFLLDL